MPHLIGFLLALLLSYRLAEAVHMYKFGNEITTQYADGTVEMVKVLQVLKNAVEKVKVVKNVSSEEGAGNVEAKEIEVIVPAAVLLVELVSRTTKEGIAQTPEEPRPRYVLKIASVPEKDFLVVNETNNLVDLDAYVENSKLPRALEGRLTRMYGGGTVILPADATGRQVLKLEELYKDFFESLSNMHQVTQKNKKDFAKQFTLYLREMVYTMYLYHAQSFVHGDIKAENFMRASAGSIDGILIDLASSTNANTDLELAKVLSACLTPQYAPYAWHLNSVDYLGTKERDFESLAYSMLYIVSDEFSKQLDLVRKIMDVNERTAKYKALKLWLLKYLLTDESEKEMSKELAHIFYKMIRIGMNGLGLPEVGPKKLDYDELIGLIDDELTTFG